MLDVLLEEQSIKKRGVEAFYTTANPSMGHNPISISHCISSMGHNPISISHCISSICSFLFPAVFLLFVHWYFLGICRMYFYFICCGYIFNKSRREGWRHSTQPPIPQWDIILFLFPTVFPQLDIIPFLFPTVFPCFVHCHFLGISQLYFYFILNHVERGGGILHNRQSLNGT